MEAQFIASVTADPKRFTAEDARAWAAEFDSWDIVDGVSDLFVDTDHWRELIEEFAEDEREFVRRTAFAMMAWSVVHRKKEPDEIFLDLATADRDPFATDDRNFVKKAVSWALRSIGKRNRKTERRSARPVGKTGSFREPHGSLDRQGRNHATSPVLRRWRGWRRRQIAKKR